MNPPTDPASATHPMVRHPPPRGARRWLRLGLCIAAILLLQAAGGWAVDQAWIEIWPRHSRMLDLAAIVIAAVYTLTMAIPFVPGIEIGLAVMLAFGQSAILSVYTCTQFALLLSFILGRLVPVTVLIRLTDWLHLHAVAALLRRVEPLPPADRLNELVGDTRHRWRRALVEHRYVALAVLINTPGNALLGGAGGLGVLAGMSRVISLPRYLVTMAVATSPVPLLLWLGGID